MRSLKPQSPCMLSRFLERMAFVASGFGRSVRQPASTHLTYAAPAWWGYADSGAKHQLQSVLAKLKRYGFLPPDFPSHQQLCDKMDKQLFLQILDNHTHVLHQLLPPRKDTQHSLRPRAHNRIIPPADAKFKRKFN